MNKQTIIVVLLLAAVASLAYGIYRSTGEKIITTQPGVQTIYGEPQHGLILGLCILSGFCILSIIVLLLDRDRRPIDTIEREEPPLREKKRLL